MATYILQRCYSNSDGEKKGMSTGAKIALGVGTVAAGFAGARRGMLGNSLAIRSNALWGNAGRAIGSTGMINSAATQIGKTTARQHAKLTGTAVNTMGNMRAGVTDKNRVLNIWNSGGKVTAEKLDLGKAGKFVVATPKL